MTYLCQTIGEVVVLGIITVGCPFVVFKAMEWIDRIWRHRG